MIKLNHLDSAKCSLPAVAVFEAAFLGIGEDVGHVAVDDVFLHLIQVGDTSMTSMINSFPVKTDDMLGVRFVFENRDYELKFNIKDEPGGEISISRGGIRILTKKLTNEVKPQEGI